MPATIIFLLSALFWSDLCVVILVVFLAAFGKSLGVRKKSADVLLKIFEWGLAQEENVFEVELEDEIAEDTVENVDAKLSGPRKRRSSGCRGIIKREKSDSIEAKLRNLDESTTRNGTVKVIVDDTFDFIMAGIESIIEDQVTSRFKAEELASWNLLTRTSFGYQHINWKLTFLWMSGCFLRYLILLPARATLFFVGLALMVIVTFAAGYVSNARLKKWLNRRAMLMCMRIASRSFSCIVQFHDQENRALHGGISVANHTSPIDVMILSCDNCYAMIGQRQGGILGFMQSALSRATSHIWFERSEAKDRGQVSKRLKEHVDDPNKLPVLIFPEGTCINNTSVMMFKKGSFEIGRTIYPIVMKYDSRFGDPFWNSSEQSYGEYLFRMMTSWAIICDVWYLPPMTRRDGEDGICFGRRVKHAIAEKGGLVDLEWDGNLKRSKVPNKLIAEHQRMYWDRLSRKTTLAHHIDSCEHDRLADGLEKRSHLFVDSSDQIEKSTVQWPVDEQRETSSQGDPGNDCSAYSR